MPIKRRHREESEINVGSFSDIAFLIIIFFILTTTFFKPAGRPLDIPSGTADPQQKQQQQLTVVLSPGEIRYGPDGRSLNLDQLRQTLVREKLARRPPDQRIVVVESKPTVPYDEYFQVIMAISQAGGVLGLLEAAETAAITP
jgi:biopolymer transport protein ExbD